jgi:hypothetical protein
MTANYTVPPGKSLDFVKNWKKFEEGILREGGCNWVSLNAAQSYKTNHYV